MNLQLKYQSVRERERIWAITKGLWEETEANYLKYQSKYQYNIYVCVIIYKIIKYKQYQSNTTENTIYKLQNHGK